MNRDAAVALLDRLHTAQNDFYAGGSATALDELLAGDITWTVPGDAHRRAHRRRATIGGREHRWSTVGL